MKGIQNKIIIYKKAFIIHILGYTITKGKSFFWVYNFLNFNVGSLCGMTNIQTIFDLVPRSLKHVRCYCSHRVPYAGLQVLKVVDLNLAYNVSNVTPQEKNPVGLNMTT
jgi:hypothetical protein